MAHLSRYKQSGSEGKRYDEGRKGLSATLENPSCVSQGSLVTEFIGSLCIVREFGDDLQSVVQVANNGQ